VSGPVYLHVGLPKTGTTYLQSLLATHRPDLRRVGFLYPFVRPEGMFHAAVELRRQYDVWGLDPALVDGTWARLCAKARAFDGTSVVSHEILGGASAEELSRAMAPLHDLEVHVVLTVRDPARQVPAHWQEQVKNGRTYSFAQLVEEVRGPHTRDVGDFWAEQDLLDTLDRWGAVVPPERLHVVVCPPPGADPALLWDRFAAAVGLNPDVVDPAAATGTNTSLGTPQVALLRAVNVALAGRLVQPRYAHRVKRYFAQKVLAEASLGQPRPACPPSMDAELMALATSWVEALEQRGHPVHGDLAELLPAPGRPGVPHPDDVPADAAPAELAAVLARVLVDMDELATGPEPDPSRPGLRGLVQSLRTQVRWP